MQKHQLTIIVIGLVATSFVVGVLVWGWKYEPQVVQYFRLIKDTNSSVNINTNTNIEIELNESFKEILYTEESYRVLKNLKNEYPEWFGSRNVLNVGNLKWQFKDDGYEIAFGNTFDIYAVNVTKKTEGRFFRDIEKYFDDNNFKPNELNSQDYIDNSSYYGYSTNTHAYENNEHKCKVIFFSSIDSYPNNKYNIQCATYIKEYELKYKELEPVFKPGYFSIKKYDDNFAIGDGWYDGPGGGYWWMAKKINEQWKQIIKSQEDPFCSELEEYKVPDSFYDGKCYEDDGNTEREWKLE